MITPVLACIGGLHSTGGATFTGGATDAADAVAPVAEGEPFTTEGEAVVLTPSVAKVAFGVGFRFKR